MIFLVWNYVPAEGPKNSKFKGLGKKYLGKDFVLTSVLVKEASALELTGDMKYAGGFLKPETVVEVKFRFEDERPFFMKWSDFVNLQK